MLRLTHEIGQQTKATFDKRQREAVLREQMATIQRSSAKATRAPPRAQELNEKLARAGMPEDIEEQARRELRRCERMPEGATEAGMVRTYLDWLSICPGRCPRSGRSTSPRRARILDADHFGLEKIKQRIIEYLAVRKLAPNGKAADSLLRRPARRRQDLARPVDRARDGPRRSCASASAACMTRPKSAATAAPMSARCPATSSRRSARPARAIA